MKTKLATFALPLLYLLSAHSPSLADDKSAFDSLRACEKNSGPSQCWKSAEQYLQDLAKLDDPKSLEKRLLNYYMLARMAHIAGDLDDSERFLRTVEQLEIERHSSPKIGQTSLTPVIEYDKGLLFLSKHSYASALRAFDNAVIANKNNTRPEEFNQEVYIAKASALAGMSPSQSQLQSKTLEDELANIIDSLNFKEHTPAIVWPIGPQLIGPYAKARRVAAAYARLNQFERALQIIEQAENERQQARSVENEVDQKIKQLTKPWANFCDPIDLMLDKSEILIRQGKLQAAEAILENVSKHDQYQNPIHIKRLLLKRAKIAALAGNTKHQAKYTNEAAAIIDSSPKKFDPTIKTFGFLD